MKKKNIPLHYNVYQEPDKSAAAHLYVAKEVR